MTAEQKDLLQPAAVRGRLGVDLFSSALMWQMRTRVLPFRDRADMAADMERGAIAELALAESVRPALHDAVLEWAAAWPQEVLDAPADPMAIQGMVPTSLLQEAARRQLALLLRIIELGRVDDATAARIRAIEFVLVPVKRA